jgi:hypothetical protein
MTAILAAAFDGGVSTQDTVQLRQVTARAGLELKPQSPGSDRPPDAQQETFWYWADVDEGRPPDDFSAALMRVPGVTAAYLKPEEEVP